MSETEAPLLEGADDAEPVQAPPTGRSEEELEALDVCPTPPELALAICQFAREYLGDTLPERPVVLEPSAGDGAFVKAVADIWPAHVWAIEIREECEEALRAAGAERTLMTDLLDPIAADRGFISPEVDLVIGNPPFSKAEEHLRFLFANLRKEAYVFFLLRLGFLESFDRVPFWTDFPPRVVRPLVPRPGFKLNGQGKKGTDQQSYGLFVWCVGEKAAATNLRLPPLVWRKPIRDASARAPDAPAKARRGRRKKEAPPGQVRCTCTKRKVKDDCPVGLRVGNHPARSTVDASLPIGGEAPSAPLLE